MADIIDRLRDAREPYRYSKVYEEACTHNALLDAETEIERMRAALVYVLEDEPNLLPRATSACRQHIRKVLSATADKEQR